MAFVGVRESDDLPISYNTNPRFPPSSIRHHHHNHPSSSLISPDERIAVGPLTLLRPAVRGVLCKGLTFLCRCIFQKTACMYVCERD